MRFLINALNAGEFSPELEGRTDLESIRRACRIHRNAIPRTLGGSRRRPGMLHLGFAKYADRKCRLLPFNFSATSRFVLELGHLYLRFWKDGAPVGAPLEVAAPWTEDQLFSVQMVQVNDLIFFTHPAVPVYELRRVTDTNWTLAPLAWNWPAMRDENITMTTLAAAATTGNTTLTASAAQFTEQDVGAYYALTHQRASASEELALTATGNSGTTKANTLRVLGQWEVYSFGTWAGTVFLETLDEAGNWQVLRSWSGQSDRNIQANGTVERETWMRLRFSYTSHTGTVAPRAVLEALDQEVHGLVKVTGYTSPTVVDVEVVRELSSTDATLRWSEGAWSLRRGYPRAVALHQQRLIFAGTDAEPQKVWGSAVNDFNNFQLTGLDDAAFSVQVAAQEANPIVWLASTDGLIVGTEGDEWLMDSGNGIISASNPPNVKRKTKFGSADIQAQLVGSVVLFIQRGGRRMREYVFAFDEQGYRAPDLTQLADHLTRSGFRQFAYAQNPDSNIWAVTNDGRLLSCTYQRESEVIAWSPHITTGSVESVAVISGTGDADEVWLSVARTVNGTTSRRIERFDPQHWTRLEDETQALLCYLDAATVTTGTDMETVSGLSHLEGQEVAILADGAVHPARRVSSGAVSLDEPADTVIVGLPFETVVQPFPFDAQLQDGPSSGRMQRTAEIRLKVWKTGAAEYADDPAKPFYAVPFRAADAPTDEATPLFSGETEPLTMQAHHRTTLDVTIRVRDPLPLNLLAIVTLTAIHGE